MNAGVVRLAEVEGLIAVRRVEHLVALATEDCASECGAARRPRRGGWSRFRRAAGSARGASIVSAARSVRGRYTLKVAPCPGSLVTVTCPPLCWTMPKTVDQTQAGPFARLLGREEGLEDALARRGVHPRCPCRSSRAGRSRPGRRRGARLAYAASSSTSGLDRELATVGHRVARVHREVHDDLLDLARIGVHLARARRRERGSARCPRRAGAAASSPCPATTSARSRTFGWSTCLRLNARSCRVRTAARSARLVHLLDLVPDADCPSGSSWSAMAV